MPAARRRSDDTDGLIAGLEHHLERGDDRGPGRQRPHIDVMVDRRRQIGAGKQPPLLAELDRNRPSPDAVEDLVRQRFRNHAGRCGVENQRRGIGRS